MSTLCKEMTTIKQIDERPVVTLIEPGTVFAAKRRNCTGCRTYQVASFYHVIGTYSHYCYRADEVVHVTWPGEHA